MKQICCVCKVQYGTKPPFDNDEETHGFCPECYKLEMKKIQRYFNREGENGLGNLA